MIAEILAYVLGTLFLGIAPIIAFTIYADRKLRWPDHRIQATGITWTLLVAITLFTIIQQ